MRRLSLILVAWALAAGAAQAQAQSQVQSQAQSGQAGAQIEAVATPPISEPRMALARRYVEVVQSDQLTKAMEESFEYGFQQGGGLPAEERDFLRAQGLLATRRAIPQMFEAMTPLVAEIYNEVELEAMIAFSETPIGQSINAKTAIFGARQAEALQPIVEGVIRDIMAKYCARFECPDGAPGTGRQKPPG